MRHLERSMPRIDFFIHIVDFSETEDDIILLVTYKKEEQHESKLIPNRWNNLEMTFIAS